MEEKFIKFGKNLVTTEESGVFPPYEMENGHYRLKADPPKVKPVKECSSYKDNTDT